MINTVRQLVNAAFDSNKYHELRLGLVDNDQAAQLKGILKDDLKGCGRYIDSYAIKHCIKNHGNAKTEAQRGQIVVTLDDFEKIPDIIKNPDKIEYAGKNSLKQDLIKYTKRLGDTYIMVEAVRVKSAGNRLYFQTMYKRK